MDTESIAVDADTAVLVKDLTNSTERLVVFHHERRQSGPIAIPGTNLDFKIAATHAFRLCRQVSCAERLRHFAIDFNRPGKGPSDDNRPLRRYFGLSREFVGFHLPGEIRVSGNLEVDFKVGYLPNWPDPLQMGKSVATSDCATNENRLPPSVSLREGPITPVWCRVGDSATARSRSQC